jgi:tryptophanyl-tRNA synthetase
MQDDHDCLFMVVDLHAITVPQDPAELAARTLDVVAQYLACGVDPGRHAVFVQSHVPAHAQLAWILTCIASTGELSRMTQYKNKVAKRGGESPAGLFCYPVLMAADILLYRTAVVPIGDDQRQHLELARDLAERFNARYGEVFLMPRAHHPDVGARIMSLRDPSRKMDKSSPDPESYIALLDDPEAVVRKIGRAVTDSGGRVALDPARPGIANLFAIYMAVTGRSSEEVEARFAGKGYADFKRELADALVALLEPIQAHYRAFREDRLGLTAILRRGAERARAKAEPVLSRVHRAVGFLDV